MAREEYRSSLVGSQPVSAGFYQPLHLAKNQAWSSWGRVAAAPAAGPGASWEPVRTI